MSSEPAEQESEWCRVRLPGLIAPGTLETIQSGIEGEVDEDGQVRTDAVPDTLVLDARDALEPGTEVTISVRHRNVYCKPTEPAARERQRARKKRAARERNRAEQRRKRRAAFWSQYDIPIAFNTAQNNRISELRRGSTGTGQTSSTKTHLLVLEDFSDGRLEREAGRFLCKGEGQYSDTSMGLADRTPAHADGSTPEITCKTCLKRMERWEITSEASGDGEESGGDAR